MMVPNSTYIKGLRDLRDDLNIIMSGLPSGPSSDAAKKHADTIAPLIAGQEEMLKNGATRLNVADPMKLRSELEKLCSLMTGAAEKKKLGEHIAMLNSLINDKAA